MTPDPADVRAIALDERGGVEICNHAISQWNNNAYGMSAEECAKNKSEWLAMRRAVREYLAELRRAK